MSKIAKRNLLVKIFCIVLMVCMTLSFVNSVYATGDRPNPSDITADYSHTGGISTIGGQIIGIITTVGVVVSVVVLVVLGIKYMIGSAEEKAEYKKTMIPYIIGAILVFAASTIASIVMSVADNFKTTTTP